MTLKVIGSGETVEQVFWLDTRTRTCGVKLRHPVTGYERCSERALADLLVAGAGGRGAGAPADVEVAVGNRAQVILGDE